MSDGTEKKNLTTSYPHCLQIKAHVPSILKFHALTVCDRIPFSAGHGIAKMLIIDFCQFFSFRKGRIVFIKIMK